MKSYAVYRMVSFMCNDLECTPDPGSKAAVFFESNMPKTVQDRAVVTTKH